MIRENKNDIGTKIILFLIYPFGAFLYSLKDIRKNSSYFVFFLFILLYALSFEANLESMDASRYIERFHYFSANAELGFNRIIDDFFSKDSETKDIFEYALYYLAYLLAGDNYHVFFFLVAIVFAWFFLRSMKIITSDVNFRNDAFCLLLVFMFAMSNWILNLVSVRFWTATWIAVYVTLQVLVNNNRRYVLLLLITPLIHAAFYLFIAFSLIAYIVRKRYKILPYLFFVSFFITDIALQFIPDITGYLPPSLQLMVWAYTSSEGALESIAGDSSGGVPLYAQLLSSIMPKYYKLLLIFLLIRERKKFSCEGSESFLGFLLAYGTLVNLMSIIPSMMRFWAVLTPLYVYLWIHERHVMFKYRNWIYLYPLMYIYVLFQIFREMIQTTNIFLFISNSLHIVVHSLLH